jgi:uncharacterized protein YecT (DUF1311 family)
MTQYQTIASVRRMIAGLLLAAATAPIGLGWAQPAAAQANTCQDPQDQSTMNRCAYESWERVDRTLNQIYQSTIARLSPGQQQQLVAAQQAWIAFRDRHCAFTSGTFEGGSMQPLIEWSCKESTTQDRLNDLQAYRRGTVVPARGQSLAASDAALNRVYQRLLRSQSGNQRSRLIAAEEAWIRFRDRACAFERSLQPVGDRCAIRLSDNRTADLEEATTARKSIAHETGVISNSPRHCR